MIWTKQSVIELIEMLRAAPPLWDIKSKEYRDRNLKFDELAKIASHFETNVEEISKKIKSLKTQFSRERKKILEKSRSEAGAISEDNVWFGYNIMCFLVENNISKGSRSTIEEDTVEEANHGDPALSISSREHDEEDETQQETEPSTSHSSSQTLKPSSDASMPIKNRKRKTNNDAMVDEAYKFMKSIQENVTAKDEFAVYGENVASRMRSANQNTRAVAIAKNQIDNILFQLEMGAFAISEAEKSDRRPSYQLPDHRRNYTHHPVSYYSSQPSPTLSSASIPLSATTSTSYPSPSSTPNQSMHAFGMPQYQSAPHSQPACFNFSEPFSTTE